MALPTNVVKIRANIFPSAHPAVGDWATFPWHRPDKGDESAADRPHSSQSFCISVWGTAASKEGAVVRRVIAELLSDQALGAAWTESADLRLEYSRSELLGELGAGNPTQIDALLDLPGMTVAVESKLTEHLGSCSQVPTQCTGRYEAGSDLKTHSTAPCRLTIADGRRTPRRYWEVMRSLSLDGAYPEAQECPFKGSGYQVMRVIAFAAAMAREEGESDWRAVFAYSEDEGTRKVIDTVSDRLLPGHRNRVKHLDYRSLANRLMSEDDPISEALGKHLNARL